MDSLGTNSFAGSGLQSDPVPHERRRLPRQVAHTPAYAIVSLPSDSTAVEISEILDATENGICVSSEVNLAKDELDLCLDFTETQSRIQASGQVVWSGNGRAGIQFGGLSQPSLHQLREWLHLNGIVAAADHRATAVENVPVSPLQSANAGEPSSVIFESPESPDFSSLLLALEAVRREALALVPNVDAALQLVAERAKSFTRATGAAIALFDGTTESMLCRASAGEAPGIGSRLNVGSGFSGQCVRTAKLLRCDDSELNLFVDRESCRALGIRSMIAVPVGPAADVKGLLEVFSPQPGSFSTCDDAVLRRLADTSLAVLQRSDVRVTSGSKEALSDRRTEEKLRSVMQELSSSHSRRLALMITAAVLAVLTLVLLVPRFYSARSSAKPVSQNPAAASNATPVSSQVPSNDFDSLRQLADAGDAAAQFAVGAHYATGDGVSQDYSEAVRWFTRAAERGHIVAQGTLGAYYWNALGVHQDLNKAYFWSILAQAGGDQASKYRASILASRLTHAEVIAAQQQANDWLQQHRKPSPAR